MKRKFVITILILIISGACYNLIGQNNTNYGTYAGNAGQENCSYGYYAGNVVTGDFNNSIGSLAGLAITSGNYNTFSGYRTGVTTTTGTWNTFVGAKAGTLNFTGTTNVFVGGNAGYSNTTSSHNVFVGYAAGYNSTGSDNLFIGYNAGYSNTTSSHNVYVGLSAGYNSTGSDNLFIGYNAGYNETGSNRLYIANSSSNSIISGDFVQRRIGINTTSFNYGQLEIKPYTADCNHGITLNMGAGSTARAYLKSDGGSDYNWHITRCGNDLKGITISKDGYIGINRTNPTNWLEVQGNIVNGGSDFILGKYDGRAQGSNPSNRALVHDNNDELTINYAGDFEGGVRIAGAYDNKINGTLSIGSTAIPDGFLLSVDGAIIAEEIQVELSENWPDYVFDKDRQLMSLSDLKEYIDKYKHLPDVPSGQEIKETGVNLGEMNSILLRKIEELTLYLIDLKKENLELEKKIDKLETSKL